MMNESGLAIVTEGVQKKYGAITALDDLTISVPQGEIFGLVGANGAGKTTLIKILVGITRPQAGKVRVLGLDPQREKSEVRNQIGYMPQAPALYEDLTAWENLQFFAGAQQIERRTARLEEVLAFVDLAGRKHDLVYGFSGGMKQRLSLACALIHRPRLLLLDEPSTGVDPRLRETFWSHFRQLAREGVTILISTHQMDEALHCTRVAIMRDGALLACDRPRSLLSRGQATIRIWCGEEQQTMTMDNYSEQLPGLLQTNPAITRVEVENDTLEDVILDLIRTREETNA